MIKVKNIFSNIPKILPDELFEDILSTKNFRVERIVSKEHTTPKGKWYNQEQNEFVMILEGNAELFFEEGIVKMKKGDYIIIPAHVKHRVEKTDNVVWLTIFY